MDTYSIKSPYVFLFFKVLLKYLSDTYTCTVEEIKDSTVMKGFIILTDFIAASSPTVVKPQAGQQWLHFSDLYLKSSITFRDISESHFHIQIST